MSSTYWKPGEAGDRDDVAELRGHASRKGGYETLEQQRSHLPVWQQRRELLYAIDTFETIVLVGETGSGKSTQIPQILMEHFNNISDGRTNRIVIAQPRRIAAITLATRVAEEMRYHASSAGGAVGAQLGEEVGYHVRFDSCYSAERTRVLYVTDGILVRETSSDPLLLRYSVIVVDDAHERSLSSDLLLGLLKKIQRRRRELSNGAGGAGGGGGPLCSPLRIIVTSATLEAALLKDFFESNPHTHDALSSALSANQKAAAKNHTAANVSGDTACIMSLEGQRAHPVEVHYLATPAANYLRAAVDTVLKLHSAYPLGRMRRPDGSEDAEGDILVFLPTGEDCDRCVSDLQEQSADPTLAAVALYAGLPQHLQLKVFHPTNGGGGRAQRGTSSGVRRAIFSTNVAESSVTLPGVRFVVDACLSRVSYFDVVSGVDVLLTAPASRVSAAQRAGRAGREAPGACYRLLTEDTFLHSPEILDRTPPEMQRCDVSATVLQLKAIGVDDVCHFDFISPPAPAALVYALELLVGLGALDSESGALTELGRNMAALPVAPQMAKCLLAAHDEFGEEDQQQQRLTVNDNGRDSGRGAGHRPLVEDMLSVAAMCNVDCPFARGGRGGGGGGSAAAAERQEKHAAFVSLDGDHITLLNVYNACAEAVADVPQRRGGGRSGGGAAAAARSEWCRENFISPRVMSRAVEIRAQLSTALTQVLVARAVRRGGSSVRVQPNEKPAAGAQSRSVLLRRCLLSGYFCCVAQLGNDGCYRSLRGTRSSPALLPHAQSVFATYSSGGPPAWVVYHDVVYTASSTTGGPGGEDDGAAGRMRDVTRIDPRWILACASHYYSVGA